MQLRTRFKRKGQGKILTWSEKELDAKGDTTGEGPEGTSPSGKSNRPVCYSHKKGQCGNKSACHHSHQNVHTKHPKVVANDWISPYLCTGKTGDHNTKRSGNVTLPVLS